MVAWRAQEQAKAAAFGITDVCNRCTEPVLA